MSDVPRPGGLQGGPHTFLALRSATPARIGLGRMGQGLPTRPMLEFQLAHARARDAVYSTLDERRLRDAVGPDSVVVRSAARDRDAYLRNPDLGRRLGSETAALRPGPYDVALVLADGLSAKAVQVHAPRVVAGIRGRLPLESFAPVVIAHQARVAIGDPIGARLGARVVVVLIGERPGLSAPDSLGAYITWAPRVGRQDSERNCVSNIRFPDGLDPDDAADRIAWILAEARRLGSTGVALKDRHEAAVSVTSAGSQPIAPIGEGQVVVLGPGPAEPGVR